MKHGKRVAERRLAVSASRSSADRVEVYRGSYTAFVLHDGGMFSDRVLDPSALIGGECELRVWAERSANHSAGCRPGGLSVDRPWFAMICGEQVGHVCAAEPGSTQKRG